MTCGRRTTGNAETSMERLMDFCIIVHVADIKG